MENFNSPKKISGWIKFIAFSLVVSFVLNIFTLLNTNLKATWDGTWSKFTSSTSEFYHPIYLPSFLLDLLVNIFLTLVLAVAIKMYFNRDKEFPKTYAYILLFNIASLILSTIIISSYPNPASEVLKTQEKAIGRSILFGLIWIPYIFRSLAVKETFTKVPPIISSITLHKFFLSAFLTIFLLFSWGISRKNGTVITEIKNPQPDLNQQVQLPSAKDIAKIALENLVVIEPHDKLGKQIGVGSGFFILPDLIVTNAHVMKNASTAYIHRPNESTTDSVLEIVAIDHVTDLALIRPKKMRTTTPLSLGNFESVEIGSRVYTAGNPQGLEGTFSDGLLSNRLRNNGVEIIQISAPISQGSSGGPVFNDQGDVIGVSTAIFKNGQNLNWAIPSVYISRLIMKTPVYYPLNSNSNLSENASIAELFPQVCDHLIDIALPEKHFTEFSAKDIQQKKLAKICSSSMPDCKRIWYNKKTEAAIFVGSRGLDSDALAKLTKNDFDSLMNKLVDSSKGAYRSTNPESTFKVSQRDLKSHTVRVDLDASYLSEGERLTDHRSYYFILPYCRFEILYTSSNKHELLDSRIFDAINNNFVKSLPGIDAEEALFKFSQ